MYLASEVQEQSNAPVPGHKVATKVSKSSAIPPYVPGDNPPGWQLIRELRPHALNVLFMLKVNLCLFQSSCYCLAELK